MKRVLKEIKELFTLGKLFLIAISILLLSSVYLFLITEHYAVSFIVGLIAMVFAFYHSFYLPEKMKRNLFLLKELQKYTTSVIFHLQSGYNVIDALKKSKNNLDPEIKKDIDRTIDRLEKDAILDTNHFKKYNFRPLDIFHQILEIRYNEGGDSKELFSRTSKSINFELVKYDELLRRKNALKKQLYLFLAISLSMPLIFRFMAYDLQEKFLSMGSLAIGLNVLLFLGALVSLFFIQKNATNISID